MKKTMGLFVILVLILVAANAQTKSHHTKKDKQLESELLSLKNQAFCDLYYLSLKKDNAKITPPDGSNYIQISDLAIKYSRDESLRRIINKWLNKKYLSYSPNNKLYLMRCLDFYNSIDLKSYIDSVRMIEMK